MEGLEEWAQERENWQRLDIPEKQSNRRADANVEGKMWSNHTVHSPSANEPQLMTPSAKLDQQSSFSNRPRYPLNYTTNSAQN